MHHHSHDHRAHLGRQLFEKLSHMLRHEAIGRHHHHGPGGPGRGRGRSLDADGLGDDGMGRGRKFSSDDLQLLLLALLEQKPSHGYELTKALEERSRGFYKPSPGMIYPALTYLEEIGFATVEEVSNKKCYQLSPAGREHLIAHRERVEFMLARLAHLGRKMEAIRDSMAQDRSDEALGEAGWLPEFVAARRALKHLLLARANASPEEQERIAAILRRASDEIRGDRTDSGNPPAKEDPAS